MVRKKPLAAAHAQGSALQPPLARRAAWTPNITLFSAFLFPIASASRAVPGCLFVTRASTTSKYPADGSGGWPGPPHQRLLDLARRGRDSRGNHPWGCQRTGLHGGLRRGLGS